jgi:hypothetical protein
MQMPEGLPHLDHAADVGDLHTMKMAQKIPALVAIAGFLLIFAPAAARSATAFNSGPESGGIASKAAAQANGATSDADADIPFSRTGKYWSFENYAFSFELPEAMEGYYYPHPLMTHGVVFPLGPKKKPEENRELLVWAYYSNSLFESARELSVESCQAQQERDPDLRGRAVHASATVKSGVGFECAVMRGERLFYAGATALSHDGRIVHQISLLTSHETMERDYALFNRVLATFRPDAPDVTEGSSAFTDAMRDLYASPEAPVRVLAYIKTMDIPRRGELEKELRARLADAPSLIEQYIIKYALASITRYESDFAALMEHVFLYRGTVSGGFQTALTLWQQDSLTSLYPWMARNNVYKRDAWLCGLMCRKDLACAFSDETRARYEAEFPEGTPFPPFPSGLEKKGQSGGLLSGPEILWLLEEWGVHGDEWDAWFKPFDDELIPYKAREGILDALLPLAGPGGEDAKMARLIAAPMIKKNQDRFLRKYGKLLAE